MTGAAAYQETSLGASSCWALPEPTSAAHEAPGDAEGGMRRTGLSARIVMANSVSILPKVPGTASAPFPL